MEHQLLPRERTAETGFDGVPGDDPRVHLGGEELAHVASTVLGLVHRGVRGLQQGRGLETVVRVDAHADADGDVIGWPPPRWGIVTAVMSCTRDPGVLWLVDFGQEQDELVAAVAADRIRAPDRREQPPGHR